MKYTKVAECPTLLGKWIDFISSVPPRIIFVDWETLVDAAYFELTGKTRERITPDNDFDNRQPTYDQQKQYEDAHDNAVTKLKELSKYPKLYEYLFEPKNLEKPKDIYDVEYQTAKYICLKTVHQRYEKFRQMRKDIRSIARSCADYRKRGNFVDVQTFHKSLGRQTESQYKVDFTINENGKISFESDLISVIEGVDAKRLRVCPICDDVFWAKRIEAGTCPKKRCSNDYHQRKRRIKDLEVRFDEAYKKLEKQRATVSPENSIIEEYAMKASIAHQKLVAAKLKNGIL